jgi:hypothetical protein
MSSVPLSLYVAFAIFALIKSETIDDRCLKGHFHHPAELERVELQARRLLGLNVLVLTDTSNRFMQPVRCQLFSDIYKSLAFNGINFTYIFRLTQLHPLLRIMLGYSVSTRDSIQYLDASDLHDWVKNVYATGFLFTALGTALVYDSGTF